MKKSAIDLLADYVFLSKYSQKKDDGNLETWNETVDRIYDMHNSKLEELGFADSSEIKIMIDLAKCLEYDKHILSSQRGRQFASSNKNSGILKHEAKLYNCCSTYIDRVEVFNETMYLLLCGCGVGYSLHKEYIDKLPEVKVQTGIKRNMFFVEDSIEGWADSIWELMNAMFAGEMPNINFTRIRPEGALIDRKFMAPGPQPLIKAHQHIIDIFKISEGRKLKSIEIHDIICHIADSVVAGGVRRSAMIALFDKDDELMMRAKTGNWWAENPQRAMANNSILTTYKENIKYQELKEKLGIIRQFGEPGFVNVESYEYTVNPCAEIVMLPSIDGESGFAFCNLVEINAEKLTSKKEFMDASRISSFVATVQSLYIDFKYLSPASRKIAERDRAVGVSITGIYANPNLTGRVLRDGARMVAETNASYAKLFGINKSRTCTTIKPSGNASAILGLHCSGIHPAHSNKYIRRVRCKTYSPEYIALKGTPMVKILKGDDAVISFPIESDNENMIVKDQISAVEHLKFISMVKHYWINKGSLSGKAVPNNVSATVEVSEDEWDEVASVLFTNDYLFTGVSLLPKHGDQIYDNAPFQRLSSEEVQNEFDSIKEWLKNNDIDFNKVMSSRSNFQSGDMVATGCSGGSCELI